MPGFATRFQETVQGGLEVVGNAQQRVTGNIASDVDGDSSTGNSTSADLAVPAGARVKKSYLYWQTIAKGATSPSKDVKFKVPGGEYQKVTASESASVPFGTAAGPGWAFFADVTGLLPGGDLNGSYFVADMPVYAYYSNGTTATTTFSGWSLYTVYENPGDILRQVSVLTGGRRATTPGPPATRSRT